MSSDASQSVLRLTFLACATAAFMVVWSGESSRTVGMTLAERNQHIVPAHANSKVSGRTQLAGRKAPARTVPRTAPAAAPTVVEAPRDFDALPAGSYRVVFSDGRVEWLTVIDRGSPSVPSAPAVLSTTVRGEPAHLIRVTDRPAFDSGLR